jgi:DNA repair protein RecO (recombination protein O)
MPPVTSRAIVLQRRDFRETSIIANFFTYSHGKVAGVLKGIKRREWKSTDIIEPLTLVEITFYPKRNAQVFIVSELHLIDFYLNVRNSLEKILYAMYSIELLGEFTEFEIPNAALFTLTSQVLSLMNEDADPRIVADIFQIKLLEQEGFLPDLERCSSCGKKITKTARFDTHTKNILCDACRKNAAGLEVSLGTISTIEKIKGADASMMKKIKITHSIIDELEAFSKMLVSYATGKSSRVSKTIEALSSV